MPVNCGAIPETLLSSQKLFGHERGHLPGLHTRLGRFEWLTVGLSFLDEVGK